MKTAKAKLSSKSQLVLPKSVREKLNLKTGDTVRFLESPAGIIIERALASEADDPFATFSEWASEADDKAYAEL
jgi:antitoxin PrlF